MNGVFSLNYVKINSSWWWSNYGFCEH